MYLAPQLLGATIRVFACTFLTNAQHATEIDGLCPLTLLGPSLEVVGPASVRDRQRPCPLRVGVLGKNAEAKE